MNFQSEARCFNRQALQVLQGDFTCFYVPQAFVMGTHSGLGFY